MYSSDFYTYMYNVPLYLYEQINNRLIQKDDEQKQSQSGD